MPPLLLTFWDRWPKIWAVQCFCTMLAEVMDMRLKIRDLREDRDLKQKQIADYLMCDQSLYSKYERGERPLPLEYADKLANFYGVSVDYLLGRTSEKKPYPPK